MDQLGALLAFLPPPSYDPVRQAKIDHAGRIPKDAFKISITVFFAAAILSVLVRLVIRAVTRKRLALDDYLVLLGASALCTAYGILIHHVDMFYLAEAVTSFQVIPNSAEIGPLFDMMKWIDVYTPMVWLALYSMKFVFLCFFHILISRGGKYLNWYFWFIVAFVTISWMYSTCIMFIICPHFGINSMKCLSNFNYQGYIGTSISSGLLDIISDIMIVSIPLIVLRSSQMKTAQKVSLGTMLCLSTVMIVFSLVQIIGKLSEDSFRSHKNMTVIWALYWLMMEACISVIMASVIVIRSAFIYHSNSSARSRDSRVIYRLKQQILPPRWRSRTSKQSNEQSDNSREIVVKEKNALRIPSMAFTRGTLDGMRTFIRGNGVESDGMSTDGTLCGSDEGDYHQLRRQEAMAHSKYETV